MAGNGTHPLFCLLKYLYSHPALSQKHHWDALAVQCDVKSRFLGNLVEQTARPLVKKLIPVKKAFEARFGAYPALQRIGHIAAKQCQCAAGM